MVMADKINHFTYQREEGQNPNTGFMSFQHFRGEKLYSDSIVRKENNMTETEPFECYPVAPDAPENGREEGYYPDNSIAYIRFLWKEWEPEQGKYNLKFVQDILDKAREHNQTVYFRLIAHSTRACDDVPEWLKELIDCPERPEGKRVKDSPTDPLFLELFAKAVRALGEHFDSDPTLYVMDISLPGAWGEGHNLENYPQEDMEKLFDAYTESFPNTRLIAQVWRPELVRHAMKTCRVGVRGDGFGHPYHIEEKYPHAIEELGDIWKHSPVSFESFWWLGEWQRQGWDLDEIIDVSLKWHTSSINGKSLPIPWDWQEKVEDWVAKMGYHFAIDSFGFPKEAEAGDQVQLKLAIDNVGVAPLYDKVNLCVKLSGKSETEFVTGVDVTSWLPGKHTEEFCINLPEHLESGEYQIGISIQGVNYPMVYFATDAKRSGAYYQLGCIKVQ